MEPIVTRTLTKNLWVYSNVDIEVRNKDMEVNRNEDRGGEEKGLINSMGSVGNVRWSSLKPHKSLVT